MTRLATATECTYKRVAVRAVPSFYLSELANGLIRTPGGSESSAHVTEQFEVNTYSVHAGSDTAPAPRRVRALV